MCPMYFMNGPWNGSVLTLQGFLNLDHSHHPFGTMPGSHPLEFLLVPNFTAILSAFRQPSLCTVDWCFCISYVVNILLTMTKSVTMCLAIPPNCQANVSLTKRNHLLAHKMILAQSQLRASKKLVYDLINLRCSCELYGFHRLLINYGTFGPIKAPQSIK